MYVHLFPFPLFNLFILCHHSSWKANQESHGHVNSLNSALLLGHPTIQKAHPSVPCLILNSDNPTFQTRARPSQNMLVPPPLRLAHSSVLRHPPSVGYLPLLVKCR